MFVINEVYELNHLEVIFGPSAWYTQIGIGVVYGTATTLAAWLLIRTTMMTQVREFYATMIAPLELTNFDIIFISFCAGVGEELLFRGAIQPWLGVWITAIAFVAIHGYLSPKNWRLSIYGMLMTIFMAGIGYMAIYLGLLSSMVAHMVIDIILLYLLCKQARELPSSQESIVEKEAIVD